MTCAAATFPCGIDRSTSKADSASTRVAPFSASRNAAIALFGSADKFASVSLRGLPLASRRDRRSSRHRVTDVVGIFPPRRHHPPGGRDSGRAERRMD